MFKCILLFSSEQWLLPIMLHYVALCSKPGQGATLKLLRHSPNVMSL